MVQHTNNIHHINYNFLQIEVALDYLRPIPPFNLTAFAIYHWSMDRIEKRGNKEHTFTESRYLSWTIYSESL